FRSRPVYEPGPLLTATAQRSLRVLAAFCNTSSIKSVKLLACKLGPSASTAAMVFPFFARATEHTGVAVSICRMYVFSVINIMERDRVHVLPKDGIAKYDELLNIRP